MLRLPALFVSAILLLTSQMAFAEIYKWRDENGKLHFSSTPRVLSPEVEEVEIKVPEADSSNAYRQERLLREKSYELDRKEREKERVFNKQERMLAEEKYDAEMCQRYTERYKRYRSEGVMGINIISGKKEKMSGAQAQAAIESARENMEIFCQ